MSDRKKIAGRYLRQGLLHGEEYLDLTSDHAFTVWGVENPALYLQTLENYKAVAKERTKFAAYLDRVEQTVQTLKPRLFNPALLAFDKEHALYQKGERSLTKYLDFLSRQALYLEIDLKKQYPALANLKKIQALEAIFEKQKQHYPKLSLINHYKKLSQNIQAKPVLAELEALERELFEKLAATADEKKLLDASKMVGYLKKLLNLSMTPEEYGEYRGSWMMDGGLQKTPSQSTIHKPLSTILIGFLNEKIMHLQAYYERALFLEEGYEDVVAKSEAFYDSTLARDEAFIQNMLEKMDRGSTIHHPSSAVLITGGYHTPNLKKLLKERGISYVVITPTITHETNQRRYEKILFGQQLNFASPAGFATTSAAHTMRDGAVMDNPFRAFAIANDFGALAPAAARLSVSDNPLKEANINKLNLNPVEIVKKSLEELKPEEGKISQNDEIIRNAAWILSGMGDKAQSAIPQLEKAIEKTKNNDTKKIVKRVIETIKESPSSNGARMAVMPTKEEQIKELEDRFAREKQLYGIEHGLTVESLKDFLPNLPPDKLPKTVAEAIVMMRGPILNRGNADLANANAELFRKIIYSDGPEHIFGLGLYSPEQMQSVLDVHHMLKQKGIINTPRMAAYGSGWVLAAVKNADKLIYPDNQLYSSPITQMDAAETLNNAAAQTAINSFLEGEVRPMEDWLPLYVMDLEAPMSPMHAFNMAIQAIRKGVGAFHAERQSPSHKVCGHGGGACSRPSSEQNAILKALRLAGYVMNVSVVVIGRTDAAHEKFITADDPLDRGFILGKTQNGQEMTYADAVKAGFAGEWTNREIKPGTNGFWTPDRAEGHLYRVRPGVDRVIHDMLLMGPYSDMWWSDTHSISVEEREQVADGVHKIYPNKPLADNVSPNLKQYLLSPQEIERFTTLPQRKKYKYLFMTLGSYRNVAYHTYVFAKDIAERGGWAALKDLQLKELEAAKEGYRGNKSQVMASGRFYDVIKGLTGASSEMAFVAGSTEEKKAGIEEKKDLDKGPEQKKTPEGARLGLEARVDAQLGKSVTEAYSDIFTPRVFEILDKLASLDSKRRLLLKQRLEKRERRRKGESIEFRKVTDEIPQYQAKPISVLDAQNGNFVGSEIPKDLQRQWIQGTGPAKTLRNIAYALLSGADGWMFDGEDALGQEDGLRGDATISLENQRNLKLAIAKDPKFMKVAEQVAKELQQKGELINPDWRKQLDFTTKIFRARGLHLDDRQLRYKGVPLSASMVDAVVYLVNNAKTLLANGSTPTLYLPKIQTYEEAAFWDEMLGMIEESLGLEIGTVKTFVLVEQVEITFQLMEVRAALGRRFVGFNTGRWDYINSVIDAKHGDQNFILPGISHITMTNGFMKHYEARVFQAANTPDKNGRYVHWIGGMEPNIPVGDEKAVEAAMKKAVAGKQREFEAGASGAWVAHWKMVPVVRPVWEKGLVNAGKVNQLGKMAKPLTYTAQDFKDLFERPSGKITQKELEDMISVLLQYVNGFLVGMGAVAIKPASEFLNDLVLFLMEDAATAEIRASIIWDWIHKGATFDESEDFPGQKITSDIVAQLIKKQYQKLLDESNPKNVHPETKTTTLPIAKFIVERYVFNEKKAPWLMYVMNYGLGKPEYEQVIVRINDFFEKYNQTGQPLTHNASSDKFVAIAAARLSSTDEAVNRAEDLPLTLAQGPAPRFENNKAADQLTHSLEFGKDWASTREEWQNQGSRLSAEGDLALAKAVGPVEVPQNQLIHSGDFDKEGNFAQGWQATQKEWESYGARFSTSLYSVLEGLKINNKDRSLDGLISKLESPEGQAYYWNKAIYPVQMDSYRALQYIASHDQNLSMKAEAKNALERYSYLLEFVDQQQQAANDHIQSYILPKLGHKNPDERLAAAFQLSLMRFWAEEAVPALLEQMKKENDPGVMELIKHSLNNIMNNDHYSDSVFANQQSNSIEGARLAEELKEAFDSGDFAAQINLAYQIAGLGPKVDPTVIPLLIDILKSEQTLDEKYLVKGLPAIFAPSKRNVNQAVSMALVKIGEPAVAGLLETANSQETGVSLKLEIIKLLGLIGVGAEKTLNFLVRQLTDSDSDIRLQAAKSLGDISHAVIQRNNDFRKKSGQSGQQGGYTRKLQLRGQTDPVVDELIKLTDDLVQDVRMIAITALGVIGEAAIKSSPKLIAILKNKEESSLMRARAAYTLGSIGPDSAKEGAIPALREALKSDDSSIRSGAISGLGGVMEVDAIETLSEILSSGRESNLIMQTAIETIGAMGPKAKRALDVLRNLNSHPDASVRVAAQKARAQIEPSVPDQLRSYIENLARKNPSKFQSLIKPSTVMNGKGVGMLLGVHQLNSFQSPLANILYRKSYEQLDQNQKMVVDRALTLVKVTVPKVLASSASAVIMDGSYGFEQALQARVIPDEKGMVVRRELSTSKEGPVQLDEKWTARAIAKKGAELGRLIALKLLLYRDTRKHFEKDLEEKLVVGRKVYRESAQSDVLMILEELSIQDNSDQKAESIISLIPETVDMTDVLVLEFPGDITQLGKTAEDYHKAVNWLVSPEIRSVLQGPLEEFDQNAIDQNLDKVVEVLKGYLKNTSFSVYQEQIEKQIRYILRVRRKLARPAFLSSADIDMDIFVAQLKLMLFYGDFSGYMVGRGLYWNHDISPFLEKRGVKPEDLLNDENRQKLEKEIEQILNQNALSKIQELNRIVENIGRPWWERARYNKEDVAQLLEFSIAGARLSLSEEDFPLNLASTLAPPQKGPSIDQVSGTYFLKPNVIDVAASLRERLEEKKENGARLARFFTGLAEAHELTGQRTPLVDTVYKPREVGGKVIVESDRGERFEFDVKAENARRQAEGLGAEPGILSASSLHQMRKNIIHKVLQKLQGIEASFTEPAIVFVDTRIFPEKYAEIYRPDLLAAAARLSQTAEGKNTHVVLTKDNPVVYAKMMDHEQAGDFFVEEKNLPQSVQKTAHKAIITIPEGARLALGGRNVIMQPLVVDEKTGKADVSVLEGTLTIASRAAYVNAENPPDQLQSAWEELSGSKFESKGLFSKVMKGLVDLITRIHHAIRAILRVDWNTALRTHTLSAREAGIRA
jgi:malate synthase